MKNSKFSQVSTKKVIFEAKKIVSTICQTPLNIFLTEDNSVGMKSLSHLIFFILHATFKKS